MGDIIAFPTTKKLNDKPREDIVEYLSMEQRMEIINAILSYFSDTVDNLEEQEYVNLSTYIYLITLAVESFVYKFDTDTSVYDSTLDNLNTKLSGMFSIYGEDSDLKQCQVMLEPIISFFLSQDDIDLARFLNQLFSILVIEDGEEIDEDATRRAEVISAAVNAVDSKVVESMYFPIKAINSGHKWICVDSSIGEDKFNKIQQFIEAEMGSNIQ